MPKADEPTAATIGRFYLLVQCHGQTFWAAHELTRRTKRKMVVLSQTPLFAEAFTMEELGSITKQIWAQFKGAEILPLECNTRQLVPAIMRKSINA